MKLKSFFRAGAITGALLLSANLTLSAQTDTKEGERVARKIETPSEDASTRHPLDPALRLARRGLSRLDAEIHDYTATMVRRERINGQLKPAEFSKIKVRNPHVNEQGQNVPFSVYIKFEKPIEVEDRECIYVEGRNEDKVIAHEGKGLLKHITAHLDPRGTLAMKGNRYPICDAGVRNLIVKLIEKGTRDRAHDECEVKFFRNAKINGRKCTVMQVMHPVKRDHFDFHKVQIFIDDEYQVPIRYASWSWPTEEGGKPVLEEEYTYVDFTPSVGLTDADFDHTNKAYNFK